LNAYEISNYAAAGQECRHNLVYWGGGSYVSLGPSAASHVQGWRWKNRPHLGEWEQAIASGSLPATDVEWLSDDRRRGELAMLNLRLSRGLNFADFTARTGTDVRELFAGQIDRLSRLGLVRADEDAVQLTEAGLNVADAVAAEFLSESD
jgi:oxygen-independent coproporphyrinogen-3 oxidase